VPDSNLAELYKLLVTANHILHFQHVVDAYGHISVRHPERPEVYIMSGSSAPALVESPADFIHYNVSDSSPLDPNAKKGYQERYIHGELFKRFPDINCVIHSHSEAVLPYATNGVPMRPAFHIGGFLGTHVPIWDIVQHYEKDDPQDMLVNSTKLGGALASKFAERTSVQGGIRNSPDYNVVLMQNHGFTTLGTSIPQAVYRAVYTHVNAGVQSTAIMVRNAHLSNSAIQRSESSELRYLNADQVIACQKMNDKTQERPWALWEREVETSPLYRNKA